MEQIGGESKLVAVPFHGDEIEAITGKDGKGYVVVKKICVNLGVDLSGQLRNLKKAPWATVDEMSTVDPSGSVRNHCVIPVDQLPMWMANIKVGKVAEHIRPKLIRYQLEARDVLARHFNPEPIASPAVAPAKTTSTLDLLSMGRLLIGSLEKQVELEQSVQVVQSGQLQLEQQNRELCRQLAETRAELVRATQDAARAVRTVTSESDFHTLVTWAEEHGVRLGHGKDSAEGRIINAMCRERGITPGSWRGPRYKVGTYPEDILELWLDDYHRRHDGPRLAS